MKQYIHSIVLVILLGVMANSCFGQIFRAKAGPVGYYLFLDEKESWFGKGGLAGLECKLSKKFTFQLSVSQTFVKNNYFEGQFHQYNEFTNMGEFRFYPSGAFNKYYFGIVPAVYTSKEFTSDHSYTWKDSGYKLGIEGGYIIKLNDKFDLEPQLNLWSDLGRYMAIEEIFLYPSLQMGIFLTYKF